MNEIIPGIYRLQIPIRNNPLGHTNIYLVRGNNGYLLIDAGWNSAEGFESLESQLGELNLTVDDIDTILITHTHGDHYGLVGAIKDRTEVEVVSHRIEKENLLTHHERMGETIDHIEDTFSKNGAPVEGESPMHRFRRGFGRRHHEQVIPDTTVEGGETITTDKFTLRVIWTPGHSPGHICFYEEKNKILFGGDHVLPSITPNISLVPHNGDNPLGDFMRSLQELDELDVEIVLPAHEETYTDLSKRISEITDHHDHRNSEILKTLKDGPKTAYELSSGITWMPDTGGVHYKDLPPMAQRMAMLETLAHLRAMAVDGMITSYEENGTVYYRSV